MFGLVITLDYELPASGRGDVRRHMIEPTATLLDTCERHGAQLTILVEIGELWAFEDAENSDFRQYLGYDPADEIRRQLVEAIRRGHDVQLHLHPQWINARWERPHWKLDYARYRLTDFDHDEIVGILSRAKKDLEDLLRPHCQGYECIGFRAGHWNTQPSSRYLAALRASGLKSDTSVFKWGFANNGGALFDYRAAYSNVHAWYAQPDNINEAASEGGILELPIATELASFASMLTPKRLWLATKYLREDRQIAAAVREAKGRQNTTGPIAQTRLLRRLFARYPKKLDFCKLTGRHMLSMVDKLMRQCQKRQNSLLIPLVMIGHSKQLGAARGLRAFLREVHQRFDHKSFFSTYRGFVTAYETAANKARVRAANSMGTELSNG